MIVIILIIIFLIITLFIRTIYLNKACLKLMKLHEIQDETNLKLAEYIAQNKKEIYEIKNSIYR